MQNLLFALFLSSILLGQNSSLIPLDDSQATESLVPVGVLRTAPELFGNYGHVWALEDGTRVIQYYGDFSITLGERRLSSQDAVVWMSRSQWQSTNYYHFEVFLSQQAAVRDAGGTLTTGPSLFITFNTTEPPVLNLDVSTPASSADTPLYKEASKVRQAVQAGTPQSQPAEMQVVEMNAVRGPRQPKVRHVVRHRAKEEMIQEEQGIVTATGDVYLSQGLIESGEFLEIRAQNAVLFLAQSSKTQTSPSASQPAGENAPELEPFPTEQKSTPNGPQNGVGLPGMTEAGIGARVAGAYLQGDVILSRGERMIRAAELYYDFEHDRALILDAVMRALVPDRNMPIYVRAAQVRQLSTTDYSASQAKISTSEFYTPHVHIGAEKVYLTDATPRDQSGQITGLIAGKYRMYNNTLNVDGVPVAYWPYVAGDFRQSETSVRSVRLAYTDDFGATFQSKWYLFNLLGLEAPAGVDGTLRLDYFSERGPGVGIDLDYETKNSYGQFRGYYINDHGEDDLGPYRNGEFDNENRGRLTWRHREFLPQDWELTLEGSYISDRNFLEEYFNNEFETDKEQETLVYLKKQKDNWAFTSLAQWRILDFLTQTEHLPDLAFHWIGEPLAELASFYSESHVGFLRYRPDDGRLFNANRILDNTERSDITFRGDTRNELDFPIKLGNAQVVPYVTGRTGYWDSSPDSGSTDRQFGSAGLRTGTQFWRLFENASSKLLDINGIRHIIKPEATAWASASNRPSLDLYPFDASVEDIDDFYGTSLALRQRWQTKRGGPGRWRVVDWIRFDVELNLFGNEPRYEMPIGRFYDSRPENSVARNHVKTDFQYRLSDTTSILSDTNFDLNDGDMDLFNLSYAVERTPRFSYFLGYRRIHDTDSNLIGGGMNYEINTKHRVAARAYYDLERNKFETFDITLMRKFPRWYAALTFGVDNIQDDINVSLSVWPEGAPQAALGSRRYTGLSTSTGIRPED